MFRELLRPLGIVLLAVFAMAPAVRTLCAWECAAPDTVGAGGPVEPTHCIQTTEASPDERPVLVALGGCERCDVLGEALRATVRAATAPLTPASTIPAPGMLPVLMTSAHVVVAPAHAPSPPLRAPYPLRI